MHENLRVACETAERQRFIGWRRGVLSGADDPVVPPVNARILGARLPNATVHVVPDTGHLLLMERAPRCAALIAEFLHP